MASRPHSSAGPATCGPLFIHMHRAVSSDLTPSAGDALLHLSIVPPCSAHGSSPCGPLRRCYGGIVDQRAAPKTTMVKCTSDNCECAARKRLTPSCISALCHKALLMEALHVALSIECLSQPHKSQQYSWSDLEAIDSDRQ